MSEAEKTIDNDQCDDPKCPLHGPEGLLTPKPKSLDDALAALLAQPEDATVIFEKLVNQANTRADELYSIVCKTMDDAHSIIEILPYKDRKKLIGVAILWTLDLVKALKTEDIADLSKLAESA